MAVFGAEHEETSEQGHFLGSLDGTSLPPSVDSAFYP